MERIPAAGSELVSGQMKGTALALLLLVRLPAVLGAQVDSTCTRPAWLAPVSGLSYEIGRAERLDDPLPDSHFLRRASHAAERACAWRGVQLTAVTMQAAANSAFPADRNNGALWAGRGVSGAVSAALRARWGGLQLTLSPLLYYSGNADFAIAQTFLPGYSPFANAGHEGTIDLPQRFGDQSLSGWDPGQSSLTFSAGPVTLGVSTENVWLGPAQHYPLMLSNSAAGFPHALFELRPIATPVGRLGLTTFWGRLEESNYFDQDEENDTRVLQGVMVEYSPSFAPALWLGASRLYGMRAQLPDRELLLRPLGISDDPLRTVHDYAMWALYGRYLLPSANTEIYGEWAHNAEYASLSEFLREPDQSQAYAFGLQKSFRRNDGAVRVGAEMVHLEAALPVRSGRGVNSYYTHGHVTQGHTHKGQSLGTWLGPGSDAQRISVDWLRGQRSIGFYAERNRFDDDAYYDKWALYYQFLGHDVQLLFGGRAHFDWPGISTDFDVSWGRRFNRGFALLDGAQPINESIENNLSAQLVLSWNSPLQRRQTKR